jgi:hypothetical protein
MLISFPTRNGFCFFKSANRLGFQFLEIRLGTPLGLHELLVESLIDFVESGLHDDVDLAAFLGLRIHVWLRLSSGIRDGMQKCADDSKAAKEDASIHGNTSCRVVAER